MVSSLATLVLLALGVNPLRELGTRELGRGVRGTAVCVEVVEREEEEEGAGDTVRGESGDRIGIIGEGGRREDMVSV